VDNAAVFGVVEWEKMTAGKKTWFRFFQAKGGVRFEGEKA